MRQNIKLSDDKIREKIKDFPYWNFPFVLGNVKVTGRQSEEYLEWKLNCIPKDLSGKSFLDIGANEGYFSFKAEERGAKKVLAIDAHHDPWAKKKFQVVKEILDSKCEFLELSVYDIDKLENFDVVFCMDVYYHLEDPVMALRKIFSKVNDYLIFGGYIIDERFLKIDDDKPVMYLFKPYELTPDDDTNVWGATTGCLIKMLELVGFQKVEVLGKFHERAIFKAYKW